MKKYNVSTLDIPDNFFEYMMQSKIRLGNRIQQDLYLNFKEFESLNYILINDYIYSSDINLEIEFYEDEYLRSRYDIKHVGKIKKYFVFKQWYKIKF